MSQHKRNGIWKKIQTWSILPFLVIAQLLYKPLGLSGAIFLDILNKDMWGIFSKVHAPLYLQLPLRQWVASFVVQLKCKHCPKPHCRINGVVECRCLGLLCSTLVLPSGIFNHYIQLKETLDKTLNLCKL